MYLLRMLFVVRCCTGPIAVCLLRRKLLKWPVRCNSNVARQLPELDRVYWRCKKVFSVLQIVSTAVEKKKVIEVCYGNEAMKSTLPILLEQLELC